MLERLSFVSLGRESARGQDGIGTSIRRELVLDLRAPLKSADRGNACIFWWPERYNSTRLEKSLWTASAIRWPQAITTYTRMAFGFSVPFTDRLMFQMGQVHWINLNEN